MTDIDQENALVIELTSGEVVIRLRPDLAPNHVERIKELVRQGAYNGVVFHRVIEGFMAQTGDIEFGNSGSLQYNPRRAGTGGSGRKLKAEFTETPFDRGIVGMARSQDPNSGDSQFFICFDAAHFLNGQYTVFGEVVSGMEHVDKIKRGEPVIDPDKMVSVNVAADL